VHFDVQLVVGKPVDGGRADRETQRVRDRRGERWISRSGKNHRFHGLLLPHRQVVQREGLLHCRTSTKAKAASDSAGTAPD